MAYDASIARTAEDRTVRTTSPWTAVPLMTIGGAALLSLAAVQHATAPLLLPMISAVLVCAALMLAVVAYLRGDRGADGALSLWDAAGLFAFSGFALIILADADLVAAALN
jgi:peptidoglycan/LPS O-acetylase OafA/YrhL